MDLFSTKSTNISCLFLFFVISWLRSLIDWCLWLILDVKTVCSWDKSSRDFSVVFNRSTRSLYSSIKSVKIAFKLSNFFFISSLFWDCKACFLFWSTSILLVSSLETSDIDSNNWLCREFISLSKTNIFFFISSSALSFNKISASNELCRSLRSFNCKDSVSSWCFNFETSWTSTFTSIEVSFSFNVKNTSAFSFCFFNGAICFSNS